MVEARYCLQCGKKFTPKTNKGVYCCNTCRATAHHKRKAWKHIYNHCDIFKREQLERAFKDLPEKIKKEWLPAIIDEIDYGNKGIFYKNGCACTYECSSKLWIEVMRVEKDKYLVRW